MLISSSKALPKPSTISERDLILANALAYVESLEQKIAERELAKRSAQANVSTEVNSSDPFTPEPTNA